MTNRMKQKPLFHIFALLAALAVLIAIVAIGGTLAYFNVARIQRFFHAFDFVIGVVLFCFASFCIGYVVWLSRMVSRITKGIKDISSRKFRPLKESGLFSEIYGALNKMDMDIKDSDKLRDETERARREWITNITHDLKTPLSPIEGYAELLSDNEKIETQTAQEYGTIILKNAAHAEKLINDLKLTYQLASGAIPFNPQKIRISRFLKETVIDIVNDPVFTERDIQFDSAMPEMEIFFDAGLLCRAVQNLVVNALVHNEADTQVRISVTAKSSDTIGIHIRDNGKGISEAEQKRLFERYYRGTNTTERSEGSGLGLAIADRIIKLHGGSIAVTSKPDEGTEFIISLPVKI